MCICACTRSYTLTRACACSPVLRKSKIAVSLNLFPLAAWTAFVLQTKRKRNETEGSEEAGKRERRSRRPRSKRKKRETGRESRREEGEQGSGRGDFLLYPDRKTDWGAREGSPPFLHALCKDPGLPDITKSSKTKARVPTPPPPPELPERAAPDGHKAWGRGNHVTQPTGPSPRHCHLVPSPHPFCQPWLQMLAQCHLSQKAVPTVLHPLWELSAHHGQMSFLDPVSHTGMGFTSLRHSPPERLFLNHLSESQKPLTWSCPWLPNPWPPAATQLPNKPICPVCSQTFEVSGGQCPRIEAASTPSGKAGTLSQRSCWEPQGG